jgi:hypothetical protein
MAARAKVHPTNDAIEGALRPQATQLNHAQR